MIGLSWNLLKTAPPSFVQRISCSTLNCLDTDMFRASIVYDLLKYISKEVHVGSI